jgi:chaperonin GroES
LLLVSIYSLYILLGGVLMSKVITPLGDRILVKRVSPEEKSAGGIIIPEKSQEKSSTGVVLAVGPGARDNDGNLTPINLKVGDKVLFSKWGGTEVPSDGDENTLIMNSSDVLALIEG